MAPKLDLNTLSRREELLIEHFASIDGRPVEAGIKLVKDMLVNGEIEFAMVGTANEHLHVPHPVSQHATWCTLCHEIYRVDGRA